MGVCWSSQLDQPSSSSASHFHSDTSNSQTSTAGSSFFSNVSRSSQFSAGTGDEPNLHSHLLTSPNMKMFTFAELKAATKNFRVEAVLGEGGFGQVFKGWLDEKGSGRNGSPTAVAIKKLKSESLQGFEEWQSEVNFLGSLLHPNLVKLVGYCSEAKEFLLVYEFMQKGSLENHLFGRGSVVQPLSWDLRLKISIGAARGLVFLHTSEKHVIYRDFKASNILLDGDFNAKLSDFGLAKLGPSDSQSHVTTRVMGTYGYAAPEYVNTGHLYVKSDVYGFGVVLIELLTGLRALDPTRSLEKQNLVDWVQPYLSDRRKLKNVMDIHFEGKYPSKSAFQMAELALQCIEQEPKNRPSMKDVLEILEQIEAEKANSRDARTRSNHLQHRSTISPSIEGNRRNRAANMKKV